MTYQLPARDKTQPWNTKDEQDLGENPQIQVDDKILHEHHEAQSADLFGDEADSTPLPVTVAKLGKDFAMSTSRANSLQGLQAIFQHRLAAISQLRPWDKLSELIRLVRSTTQSVARHSSTSRMDFFEVHKGGNPHQLVMNKTIGPQAELLRLVEV